MSKICYILRGLSGTGKSTLAKILKEGITSNGVASIFSTDDLFMVEGEYQFDPSKLGEYHSENLRLATDFMQRFAVWKTHTPAYCIIDNTNTQHWEYAKYKEAAEENGFFVQVVSLSWDAKDIPKYAKRNTHGVPEEAIERMAARWEH